MIDRPAPEDARRPPPGSSAATDGPAHARPLTEAGFDRAVRVHDLAQLRVALAAAAGRPVLIVSGRGAGAYAGSGWWQALPAAADAAGAGSATIVLDCDAARGAVLAAVRAGVTDILHRPEATEAPEAPAAVRLAGLAAAAGCRLWRPPLPPVLDLGTVRDPAAAARRWFDGPPPAQGGVPGRG